MPFTLRSLVVLLVLACVAGAAPAEAQILKRAKKAAKKAAERRVEQETEEAVDEAFDAIECALGDDDCIRAARDDGREVVVKDTDGQTVRTIPAGDEAAASSPAAADGDPAALKPGEGVWANYDFVPGDRVLFSDDFEDEYVGDFPRRLGYVRGNLEVVEWQGRRLLRGTGGDMLTIPVPGGVPDRFTLEFDIHDTSTAGGTLVYFTGLEDERGYEGGHVNIGNWRGSGYWVKNDPVSTNRVERLEEEVVPIRIAYDEGYLKVYAGERRIANVPQTDLPRGEAITIAPRSRTNDPIYIGSIHVAEGGRTRLYERLEADGRVVTKGILFDTGSARLRPESTPTLRDLARTLERHGDLRLRIEGHTDATGGADANLRLSQQRAEAVMAYLVQEHGIDAARLEAVGLGQTQPAADNGTPEGRQTNRRVELVRL